MNYGSIKETTKTGFGKIPSERKEMMTSRISTGERIFLITLAKPKVDLARIELILAAPWVSIYSLEVYRKVKG